MSSSSISTAHLDYLQRANLHPGQISPSHGKRGLRRLWHVTEIGATHRHLTAQQQRRLPSEDILIGLYGAKVPLAFLIQGQSSVVKLQFGTWTDQATGERATALVTQNEVILHAALNSLYPAIQITLVEVSPLDFPLCGLALGVPTPQYPQQTDDPLPIDRMIRALGNGRWAALVLAEPVAENVSTGLRHSTIEELRRVHTAAESAQAPPPLLKHYSALLEGMLQSFTTSISVGAWRTAVYLLGDVESYLRLSSGWTGIFSGENSLPEPVVWRQL